MNFEGRAEIERRRQKLQSTFEIINGHELSAEALAHYSRYLCVLISGYAEQSIKEIAADYCKKRASGPVHRYVRGQLKLLTNIDKEKLRKLVQAFDPDWWNRLEGELEDELTAFISVASTRNNISHGGDTGITVATVRQYFDQVSKVLFRLTDLFESSSK